MGLEQRVSVLECQQDKNEERFCRIECEISEFFKEVQKRFDSLDKKLEDMQAFNEQTYELLRMIYFAVKHEEAPK
ncbi:hypothetical protein [Sansalvadorimonas verongulae]|uniref:hypothetical protein n=1 Tax=Sansalvadorimonas verongulae TaxID=2172824 RepID=UPI0012BC648C|nr:hypothetical protein [Sansalvadorimonas verongulae]MTI12473.1 hypothetical protein [Sansalvadorimonas verongulae]